jgi:hypothetical protein
VLAVVLNTKFMTINELRNLISLLKSLNHEDQKASTQIKIENSLKVANRELAELVSGIKKPRLSSGSMG